MADSVKNTDSDKIKEFADMVDGVERLMKPVQEENIRLHEQLDKEKKDRHKERLGWITAVIVLGIALIAFIAFAYMTPTEFGQEQKLPEGTQSQSYSEGFTNGK